MKYKIFSAMMCDQASFEHRINEMMKIGWRPIGGVCVVKREGTGSANFDFYQAMIGE